MNCDPWFVLGGSNALGRVAATLTLLAGLVLSTPVRAEILTVCGGCEYTSLAGALQASGEGDEIVLKRGLYPEHDLLVDKPLTIRGEDGAILDGRNQGTILTVRADHVTVSGVQFVNVGRSYTKDFAAILVHGSEHFSLHGNVLQDVFFGIMIERSKHGVIADNTVSSDTRTESGSGNGIHAWHSSDLEIRDNHLFGLRDGIYLEFVNRSEISSNISHGNLRYGLHFMFSNDDTYHHNEFYENGAGVAVMFSKNITMDANVFRDNWGPASYGLLLKEIYDAELTGNRFIRNTIAISVEGSTRVNYVGNTFAANGWAIRVAGACYANTYRGNNFLRNSFDVSYHGKTNDNRFVGNYWSSYTGYDLDRDGTGDVPHRPVKLFSYIVNRAPEAVVLLRSLFVDLLNFSEKVSPAFTPDDIVDESPAMRAIG